MIVILKTLIFRNKLKMSVLQNYKQMKKINLNLFTLIALVAVVFASCQKEEHNVLVVDSMEELKKLAPANYRICWGMEFPTGTKFETKGSSIRFHLPTDYVAIGTNPQGEVVKLTEGSIICTCTTQDGVYTGFIRGDAVGCLTFTNGACTTCVGSSDNESIPDNIAALRYVVFKHGSLPEDGFAKKLSDSFRIHSIADYQELFSLPPATHTTLQRKDIQEYFKYMKDYFYPNGIDDAVKNSKTLPEGYMLIPMDLDGEIIYTKVPKRFLEKDESGVLFIPKTLGGKEPACSGNCGDKKCKLNTNNFSFMYCYGCDSGCTLHW